MDQATGVLTLTDFLSARYDEDEAVAEVAASSGSKSAFERDDYGRLLVEPARVLADVRAHRRIVDDIVTQGYLNDAPITDGLAWRVLRDLAGPYADHPDFHPDWRP